MVKINYTGQALMLFADVAEAQAATTGDTGTDQVILVGTTLYEYDASGTDLTTGDGRTWTVAVAGGAAYLPLAGGDMTGDTTQKSGTSTAHESPDGTLTASVSLNDNGELIVGSEVLYSPNYNVRSAKSHGHDAMVALDADYTFPSAGYHFVPFDYAIRDSIGAFDPANPTRLTAPPNAEEVEIGFNGNFDNTTGSQVSLLLYVNGGTASHGLISLDKLTAPAAGTSPEYLNATSHGIGVSGGDYFEVNILAGNGRKLESNTHCWFSMKVTKWGTGADMGLGQVWAGV